MKLNENNDPGYDITLYNKIQIHPDLIQLYVDLLTETFGENILEVIRELEDPFVTRYKPKGRSNEELLKWAEADLRLSGITFAIATDNFSAIDEEWVRDMADTIITEVDWKHLHDRKD